MTVSEIRVLCVDDHNLIRECVVAAIQREQGFRVAAEARTVRGAVESFTRTRPDVTVVGLHPRGLDCLQTIRAIRHVDPRARIVVYTGDENDGLHLALDAGAAGFVVKDGGSADLVRVIREVNGRSSVRPDRVRGRRDSGTGLPTLTAREVELLALLTQGLRTKAIAATLRISDHTVKVHLKSVYEKLGVHGRAAALAEGLRRGFVRLGRPSLTPSSSGALATPEARYF